MIKAIAALMAGGAIGATVVYFSIGSNVDSGTAVLIDGDRSADEIADDLNLRLAEPEPPGSADLAAAFRDLGARDIETALQTLAAIESPMARRAASLSLLDVIGDTAADADRIVAALPAAEAPAFLADWLGRRARYDPEGAFGELLALEGGAVRTMAAEKIAASWAGLDAERALGQADLLPEDEASAFRRSLLAEWARLDAEAVLAFLATTATTPLDLVEALTYLSADPEGLLAVADRRSDALGTNLEVTALGILAERDPEAARLRVEAMPASPERDQAVTMIAIFLAAEEPDVAMAWVDEMLPASPNARIVVVAGLAERDPARALDMLGQGPPTTETQMLQGLIVQTAAQDPGRAKALADELAARADTRGRSLLANLMSGWVQQDPVGALTWVIDQEAELEPVILGNAAASMANRDGAMAVAYLEQIPARYRDVWITRMAGPYARNDLDAAVEWIGQYRGQPVYDAAYFQLVTQAAQSNPTGAAQLLVSADAELQREAGGNVAASWARQDPDAAARWAVSLSDESAREGTLARIVQVVGLQDEAAARALLEARVQDPAARERISELAGLDAR